MTNVAPKICHYCGGPGETRDHIIPSSLGGPTKPWNIVPACRRCNGAKANRLPKCRCGKCQNALRAYYEGHWPRDPPRARKARSPRRRGKSKRVHICTTFCERFI